jgi:hypothetical protein
VSNHEFQFSFAASCVYLNYGCHAICHSTAVYVHCAVNTLQAPVSNHEYQFSFAASFGDDLLRQVQAVTVRVELLRCTLGQYMTVSFAAAAVAAAAAAAAQCTMHA